MFDAIRTLATLGWEAGAAIAGQFRPPVPSSEVTDLDEIAGHLAVMRALLEDMRNTISDNASAVPGHALSVAAAEGPASDPKPGAGHTESKVLRVAADGLRDWLAGEPCRATQYFAHIAEQVDAIAEVRETVEYLRG